MQTGRLTTTPLLAVARGEHQQCKAPCLTKGLQTHERSSACDMGRPVVAQTAQLVEQSMLHSATDVEMSELLCSFEYDSAVQAKAQDVARMRQVARVFGTFRPSHPDWLALRPCLTRSYKNMSSARASDTHPQFISPSSDPTQSAPPRTPNSSSRPEPSVPSPYGNSGSPYSARDTRAS